MSDETETKEQHVAHLPRPGEVIEERYKLGNTFASGGMGVIMRAEQIRTGRDVAVKLLHPHIAAKEDFAARFMREVDVATRFDHPHIVRVYDVGETDEGVLYLVMEMLDGEELKDLIAREAPLEAGVAIDIGLQMLDGLAEAHSQDVIHRDFKPGNVFVMKNRRGDYHVKLLDFGIAKLANSQESDITATGMISGTPSYIAPETLLQAEHSNPQVVDVYAAGLVLLEMLTGQRVFQGNGAPQTLLQQLKKPVRIPQKIAETPLGEVIRKATRKHPADRYQNADEMYEALEAARQATPAGLKLSPGEVPAPAPDTTPSMLEKLGQEVGESDLEMLREAPQAEEYAPDETSPTLADKPEVLGRVKTGVQIPNPSKAPKPAPKDADGATVGVGKQVTLFLLTALVIGAGGYVWMSNQSSETSTGEPVDEPQAVAEPETPQSAPEQPDPPEPAAVSPQVEEQAEPLEFTLQSEPSGAMVWADNKVLGKTGVTVEFAPDELPKTLRLELDGYQAGEVELSADSESTVTVALEATPDESAKRQVRKPEQVEPKEAPKEDDKGTDIDKMVDQYLPGE
ncbi:PEGA domain-containing protein [Persicimonas caeni]|uniref:PEGA domain-containing protein n=1 Tax=Persicimonas caeni TaxID=2292766 RepID=A0A4Y6PN19_PERCE|nr:serine/threonine-protein kinase [Persicimonas caeni]QDG49619.1 PEGA domain-containing protein [Persicimonas caeni]QED30840.1 protein kinase [Persicimonas caeni]